MAPHCPSPIYQSYDLGTVYLWAVGLPASQEGTWRWFLTALTVPTPFLPFQFHFGLHGPHSKRSAWGLAQVLISGRRFVQCFGRALCCHPRSAPHRGSLMCVQNQSWQGFAGGAEAQPARKCFLQIVFNIAVLHMCYTSVLLCGRKSWQKTLSHFW